MRRLPTKWGQALLLKLSRSRDGAQVTRYSRSLVLGCGSRCRGASLARRTLGIKWRESARQGRSDGASRWPWGWFRIVGKSPQTCWSLPNSLNAWALVALWRTLIFRDPPWLLTPHSWCPTTDRSLRHIPRSLSWTNRYQRLSSSTT